MEHSPGYAYPYAMAGQSRYVTTHASSSAFSASANPNEDWTKISDLAERRRIQNRIAQRNYRKKLKRRLEDLERRAGSSSASPEQSHLEMASTPANDFSEAPSDAVATQDSKSSVFHEARHMSPELLPLDEHSAPFDMSRHLPVSSPPTFAYSTYPPTTSYLQHEYHQEPACQASYNHFADYQYSTEYSHSLPPTLPAMFPSDYATKQEQVFGDEDMMDPFCLNYASLAGLDVPTTQSYSSSNSHVNLTDFFSSHYNSYSHL